MKDEYSTHLENANDGGILARKLKGIITDEEEERNSVQSPISESPLCRTGSSEPLIDLTSSPMGGNVESTDRRLRRQIANCNERRRMQSINAGFQSLKVLLPRRYGEKLSKAAILQHTVELIQTLRAEKMKLIEEKEAVINAKKRKTQDDNVRDRDVIDELTAALEQERRLRHLYERIFNLWTNSPVLSQFLSKVNSSLISPALPLPSVVSPAAVQTRGFTGLLPPTVLIDSLLINARINNNCCGTEQQQMIRTNLGLGLLMADIKPPNPHPSTADCLSQPPSFVMNSLDNGSSGNLNPNFYTILEAIRQLEESMVDLRGATSTTSQKQANVLVR